MNEISQAHAESPVILIVDDVPQNIQLLGSILTQKGYRVAVAMNAQQALAMVDHFLPDLIILDIMLPDMDGYDLCRQLKTKKPIVPVPIIFLTAKKQQIDEIKGFECGAVDYIVKPFNTTIAFERIKVHLNLKLAQEKLKTYNARLDRLVRVRTRDLKASEKRFMTLFEFAPDAFCISDLNGALSDGNKAFLKLFGYRDKQAMIGKKMVSSSIIDRLFSSPDPKTDRHRVDKTETIVELADGVRMDMEIKSIPVKIKGDNHILCIFRDITESKQAEKELREAEQTLRKENQLLISVVDGRYRFGDIIGKSDVMQAVYKVILKAAASDANVVITGQTGTGKELVARAIHNLSARRKNNFIPVNCGAIPEHIIESEFFGYKKGAFTGANADKKGFLDAAHQGTLFLDEVGEIGLNMQIKLLRATEGGDYTPVGGNRSITSDFRIIAATNSDLSQRVKQGMIRSDFFFRIQVITIELPPLKDRKEDLPLLIEHFAKGKKLPERIMEALHHYDWPGNVRELQNVIKRYFALKRLDFPSLSPSAPTVDHQPSTPCDLHGSQPVQTLKHILGRIEKEVISETLVRHRWHKGKACADLGIDRKTLNTKIHTHALDK